VCVSGAAFVFGRASSYVLRAISRIVLKYITVLVNGAFLIKRTTHIHKHALRLDYVVK